LTVPQTDGLPPSAELLFFDPGPWTRTVTATPVASTAPPLYALVALPFSVFGWRGLVALNTLAFLATSLLIFVFVQGRSASVDRCCGSARTRVERADVTFARWLR
jgi:hypothetical protein